MTFKEFQKTKKIMTIKEYCNYESSVTENDFCKETKLVFVYNNYLIIEQLNNNEFIVFIFNYSKVSTNLKELEIELYNEFN